MRLHKPLLACVALAVLSASGWLAQVADPKGSGGPAPGGPKASSDRPAADAAPPSKAAQPTSQPASSGAPQKTDSEKPAAPGGPGEVKRPASLPLRHPPLPEMSIVKDLSGLAETPTLQDRTTRLRSLMNKGTSDPTLVDRVTKYLVYELTKPALREKPQRDKLSEKQRFILETLNRSAANSQFRKDYTESLAKYLPDLLDNQLQVRVNAMFLMAAMEYEPLAQVFTREIANPKQPEAVKVQAISGLRALAARPGGITNVAWADQAVGALYNLIQPEVAGKLHPWTRRRAIETLGLIGRWKAFRLDEADVVLLLLDVVRDQKRDWLERAEACKAIGLMKEPLPNNFDFAVIAYEIGQFTVQLGTEALREVPEDVKWRDCALDVYHAFEGQGPTENSRAGGGPSPLRRKGLLEAMANHPAANQKADGTLTQAIYVKELKALLDPVMDSLVLEPDKKQLKGALGLLDEWLQAHQPAGRGLWMAGEPHVGADGQVDQRAAAAR